MTNGVCGSYGSFSTITPSGSYPNLVDSTVSSGNCYMYQYLVSDNLGNERTYTSENEAKIDTQSPTDPGVPTTTSPTNSESQTWTWVESTDAISGISEYSWRTSGTSVVNGVSSTNSVETNLLEGSYTFYVKAIDQAGNESEEVSSTLIVDTTPPVTTNDLNISWTKNSISIQLSCEDSLGCSTTYYTLDGTTPTTSSSFGNDIDIAEEGTYILKYFSVDIVGNEESVKSTSLFGIDNSSPQEGSISYTDGDYSIASIAITVEDGNDGTGSGIDNGSRIVQRRVASLQDGSCGSFGNYSTISPSGTYPNYLDSTVSSGYCYQYRFRVSDIVGNESIYTSENIAKVYIPVTGDVDIQSVTESSIGDTNVNISWVTDRESSSKVFYGLSTLYGSSTSETNTDTRVLSHSVQLTSLVPCTTYYYKVYSVDAQENDGYGGNKTFTTTGCVGSANIISQVPSQVPIVSGGLISLLNNGYGITISIPTLFSSEDANFQVKQLEKDAVTNTTSTPLGYRLVGQYVYDLKALVDVSSLLSAFQKSITIKMKYMDLDIATLYEGSLRIYRWDGQGWNILNNCVNDILGNEVSCTTTNFSVFGLFGETTPTKTSNIKTSTKTEANSSGFSEEQEIDVEENNFEEEKTTNVEKIGEDYIPEDSEYNKEESIPFKNIMLIISLGLFLMLSLALGISLYRKRKLEYA